MFIPYPIPMKRNTEISSGPFAKARRTDDDSEPMAVDPQSGPMAVDPPSEHMAVDPPEAVSAGRDLSDKALVLIEKMVKLQNLDNGMKGTDTAFQDALSNVYHVVLATAYSVAKLPQSFLKDIEQVKKNAAKKGASDFVDKLREALNGNDYKLWACRDPRYVQ